MKNREFVTRRSAQQRRLFFGPKDMTSDKNWVFRKERRVPKLMVNVGENRHAVYMRVQIHMHGYMLYVISFLNLVRYIMFKASYNIML